MFSDVTHEKNGAVFNEKSCRSDIRDRHREPETALGLIPELSVSIEAESNFLVVDDHFLQCTHAGPPEIIYRIYVSGSGAPWARRPLGRHAIRKVEGSGTSNHDERNSTKTYRNL